MEAKKREQNILQPGLPNVWCILIGRGGLRSQSHINNAHSALKSGPVPVFCHFGGGPEPDRSTIKGNNQKTRPRPKKTAKNRSKPVRTSLCKDRGPDWSKPVMTFFFQHPLTYCRQNTQKISQIGPELSEISSKPSLNAKFVHSNSVLMISHSILDQFVKFFVCFDGNK